MTPESGSPGLLGNSTALNSGLWSLSGPAAALQGHLEVARATVPTVPTLPELSGLLMPGYTWCGAFGSRENVPKGRAGEIQR